MKTSDTAGHRNQNWTTHWSEATMNTLCLISKGDGGMVLLMSGLVMHAVSKTITCKVWECLTC
jgi:hypothetical protein